MMSKQTNLNLAAYNFIKDNIINASSNTYMIKMMNNIYDQNQRIRVLSNRNEERLEVSNDEHTTMIQAQIDNNISEAEKRLIEHLSNAHMNALNL